MPDQTQVTKMAPPGDGRADAHDPAPPAETDLVAEPAPSFSSTGEGGDGEERMTIIERLTAIRVPPKLWRGAVAVTVLMVVWHLVAEYYISRPIILVGPIDSIQALIDVARSGELWRHAQVSGREFLVGFGIGCAIGIPLGLVTGTMPRLKEFLDPILNGLYATPLIALAPLFIVWFGVGETKTIVLIIILVALPVAVNTDTGIRSTDPVLLEAARSFGANRRQRFTMVQLPWSLSFIVTGLRLGVGRGLIGVVVGELFGSRAGLGFMILQASQVFNTALVLGGVLLFAVLGVTMVLVMEWVERRIAPWRNQ